MIQIEYLALILTGIGIIVSILYYARATREHQESTSVKKSTISSIAVSVIS